MLITRKIKAGLGLRVDLVEAKLLLVVLIEGLDLVHCFAWDALYQLLPVSTVLLECRHEGILFLLGPVGDLALLNFDRGAPFWGCTLGAGAGVRVGIGSGSGSGSGSGIWRLLLQLLELL